MSECELSNLIGELERAEAGSRMLDGRIWQATAEVSADRWKIMIFDAGDVWYLRDEEDSVAYEAPPAFSTSIDAALTLKPDEYYLFEAEENIKGGDWMFLFRRREYGEPETDAEGIARTPALALCIAALKARQAND